MPAQPIRNSTVVRRENGIVTTHARSPERPAKRGEAEADQPAENERIPAEPEHALGRGQQPIDARRRRPDVIGAEPVAPELGVELRQQLVL